MLLRLSVILTMGLFGFFNGGGISYPTFEKWMDKTLSAPLPDGIAAFCFNMYEDGGGKWSVEIIGSPKFDKEDSDWACYEVFENRKDCLRWKNTYPWDANLELIKSYIERYLKEGKYAHLLKDKEGLGVGFVDGDLILIEIS